MNVHISYKVRKTSDIEREINHLLEKLNRRLHAFPPELVHLKGLIEQNSAREGAVVSLNLRLPSGQMAAQESGANALAALKAASDDLVLQVKKHKDLLRSSHKWRRRGVAPRMSEDSREGIEAPIEAGSAAVPSAVLPAQDIRSYVNAHLGRLERFVERELYFRETAGQMNSGSVAKEEVLDEVVVRALSETGEGPERLALEPWLYQLAIQSISDLAARASQGISDVPLERSIHGPDVSASGETELEFHQPDEFVRESDTIADGATKTPEDIAYTDELISLVQFALGDASGSDREVFVLHALEGFSVAEIAAITDRKAEEVQSSIGAVRERLRHSATVRNGFKEKHLQRTGTD
jgi:DNA-directed RNA polymerase specialized sigma24 family protein/ribosome-associated translation inhibitor RaiA